MLILIKYHDTTIALDVNPSDRIETIKELIFKRKGYKINVDLLYEGANLEDGKTLSDYNIHNLSILQWHDFSYELITKLETCVKNLTENKDKEILEIIEDYALATNLTFILCSLLTKPNLLFFDFYEKVRVKTIIPKFIELKKSLDTDELDAYLLKNNLIDFKVFFDINNIDIDDNNEKSDDDEEKETVDDEENDNNVLDESSSNKEEEEDDIYKCIINKKPRKHSV